MNRDTLAIVQIDPEEFGAAFDWYVEQSMVARGIANRIKDDFKLAAKMGSLVGALDDDNEIAGLIFIKKQRHELELSGLIIHPNLYGTGLSAILSEVAIAVMVSGYHLAEDRIVDVTCLTTASNRRAPRGFMIRNGFELTASWYQKNAEGRLDVIQKYVLKSRTSLVSVAESLMSFSGVLRNGIRCSLKLQVESSFYELGQELLDFSES